MGWEGLQSIECEKGELVQLPPLIHVQSGMSDAVAAAAAATAPALRSFSAWLRYCGLISLSHCARRDTLFDSFVNGVMNYWIIWLDNDCE